MACSIVIVSTASAELCLLTSLIGGIVATGAFLIIVFREIVLTRMLGSMDSVLLTTAAMI